MSVFAYRSTTIDGTVMDGVIAVRIVIERADLIAEINQRNATNS